MQYGRRLHIQTIDSRRHRRLFHYRRICDTDSVYASMLFALFVVCEERSQKNSQKPITVSSTFSGMAIPSADALQTTYMSDTLFRLTRRSLLVRKRRTIFSFFCRTMWALLVERTQFRYVVFLRCGETERESLSAKRQIIVRPFH